MPASPPTPADGISLQEQANGISLQERVNAAESTGTLERAPRAREQPRRSQRSRWRRLGRRLRPLRAVLAAWVVFSLFSALFAAFIVHVLLRGNVRVGRVVFDAPTSNLLVSIFSQVSVILGDALVRDLLGVVRLALTSRPGGVPAQTYLAIGPASAWTEAVRHAVVGRYYRWNLWSDFRVMLPIMGLALGSVLKFEAQFEYHFLPGSANMTVYAGLIPIRMAVVESPALTTADLSMYFYSLTNSLLVDSRYATQQRVPGCSGTCRSILLPGGLETARQHHPSSFLNHTVFEGGVFDGSDSIQLAHAPGMLARFERLPANFSFDPAGCTYAGERVNNTLVMCAQQLGKSLAVGWAACPIKEWRQKTCSPQTTWTSGPIRYSTNVSVFEQYTQTTYNRNNFSIVNVELTSPVAARQIPLREDEYRGIFRKVLSPNVTTTTTTAASRSDLSNVDALVHSLTWLHRTYDNSFPDDQQSVLTSLHNFVGVSLQFMVTAVQFANYSAPSLAGTGLLALPGTMVTSAVGGRSMQRLAIQTWTGVVFIVTEALVVALAALGIGLVLWGVEALPEPSASQEVDILRSAGGMQAARASPPRAWEWWPWREASEGTRPARSHGMEPWLGVAQRLGSEAYSLDRSGSLRRRAGGGFLKKMAYREREMLRWTVFLSSPDDAESEMRQDGEASEEESIQRREQDQL